MDGRIRHLALRGEDERLIGYKLLRARETAQGHALCDSNEFEYTRDKSRRFTVPTGERLFAACVCGDSPDDVRIAGLKVYPPPSPQPHCVTHLLLPVAYEYTDIKVEFVSPCDLIVRRCEILVDGAVHVAYELGVAVIEAIDHGLLPGISLADAMKCVYVAERDARYAQQLNL